MPRGVIALIALNSCAAPDEDGARAREWAAARGAPTSHDTVSWPRELFEFLPNIKFSTPTRPPSAATDLVVVGTVAAAEKGAGFHVAHGDAPGGTRIPFDDGRAVWTPHMVIDADTVVSDQVDGRLRAGLTIGGRDDLAAVESALRSLGRAVFFLHRAPSAFAYASGVLGVVDNGDMIATVADGTGRLDLPFVDGRSRAERLGSTASLPALMDRADDPERVIQLVDEYGTRQ